MGNWKSFMIFTMFIGLGLGVWMILLFGIMADLMVL
jgi:hypothetical protein